MADDVFLALANPVRRRLLELLAEGPRTAGALAGEFTLSRPAVAEHLGVLRRAGLVRDEPSGRERHYHLEPAPLAGIGEWLAPFERYWRGRLRDLAALVETELETELETENETELELENELDTDTDTDTELETENETENETETEVENEMDDDRASDGAPETEDR
ncbi:ArsR/SmtB family transcription factor [Pseudonocardia kujensis]|uniref:ArsR/SmtB family transcription factor n=1 Tax=Pseudonocardia kujensis TaxID=1128675 RepID=UPI0027E04EC9|nr:metalloregulator ArsR/SmtB family transcription factor [Pseudonocardia kujensis]